MTAKKIGVRQLKNEATRIVRSVREERAEYIVTVNGEPVATIRPVEPGTATTPDEQRRLAEGKLRRVRSLAHEIGQSWKAPYSAAEAVAEQRR